MKYSNPISAILHSLRKTIINSNKSCVERSRVSALLELTSNFEQCTHLDNDDHLYEEYEV
jgi:hypothetical protein